METKEFDKIRPYYDTEVKAAIIRMKEHPHFHSALNYLFSEEEKQKIIEELKDVNTSLGFQKVLMYKAIRKIVEKSSNGISLFNKSRLIEAGPAVFVANHRDILLDSAILQMVLVDLELETSEITFGSNLMINDFIIDFGKTNRMYTVFREGSAREMLENSKRLSAYINYTINHKKRSSWIAQRKGRTKNGLDKTDTTVLKMLTNFMRKDPINAFKAINIIPIIISYEIEPCDLLKIRERYLSSKQNYVKQAGEDLQSVLHGITQPKGNIHLVVGRPVNQFLEENKHTINNLNVHQKVAEYIDKEVYTNYKIYPNSYWAYDKLYGASEHKDHYSAATETFMQERLQELYEIMSLKNDELRNMFLEMYANPLIQKKKQL